MSTRMSQVSLTPSAQPQSASSEFPCQTTIESGTERVFRKSAQGFVMSEEGLFLAATPVGRSNANFLQTVQGGMEHGESEAQTLTREFEEEIGLEVGKHLLFVSLIVPKPKGVADVSTLDAAGIDAARASFRYASKTWRKLGIYGQQLCPSLFVADSSVISECVLTPKDATIRREFKSVSWVPLTSLVDCAAPAKKKVMEAIAPHVYEAALAYLSQYHPEACERFRRQSAVLKR